MDVARTDLPLTDHLEGLRAASVPFADTIDRIGKDAQVPTCPGWKTIDLVAHQGMVHRWATASLTGRSIDDDAVKQQGRRSPDPGEWLRDGVIELVMAIAAAPDDLEARRFLQDAPAAKQFWARRQCHETSIHAADAKAAQLGRPIEAADLPWLTPAIAQDGIDELLTGFLPRKRSKLRSEEPVRLLVAPSDIDAAWLVEIDEEPPRTTRLVAPVDADVVVNEPVVATYLTLWNRSAEATPERWDFWSCSAIV
ncbi:maleylpyruvate isomerase N-terminal domain-containing protein [Calidifontibacter terrae]